MIGLLRLLSFRHFGRHRLRTALTFSGIVLGVAVITAIGMVNRTLIQSFQRTIDLIAGRAVLQVTNGESGVKESLLPTVRDTRGVQDVAPTVEGFLPIVGFKGERLFIYGADLLTDSLLREHQLVGASLGMEGALDFIAPPDSIALTESLSRRLGFPVGAQISLVTSRGIKHYTVRALLKEEGTARAFGGSFALMDLPVAQIALGKEGKVDVIDLTVQEGEEIDGVKERLAARVRGTAQVQRPSERGEQVESLLASFRVGLFFVSLVALFVGVFLIYNTISVSVVQRRREIGILRCLGVTRRQVLVLFVVEALALAFAGSLSGLLAGVLLARGAIGSVTQTVSNLYLPLDTNHAVLTLPEVWIGFASGVGVAILAALHPAWEATKVGPIESARQAPWRSGRGWFSRPTLAGLLLLVLSPLLWLFTPPQIGAVAKFSLGMAAMFVFLLALCFLSPLVIMAWTRIIGYWLKPGFWIVGKIACDALARNPLRAGMTVSTLMISLAAIFTVAALVHSVRLSLLSWVDRMVTADLVVHSSAKTAGAFNVAIKEELASGLRKIRGVRVVDLYRLIRSSYQGKPIVIESFSARDSESVRDLPVVEGNGREALRRMGAGEGVIVSESFQARFGKQRGDRIELATPSGPVAFSILAVYVDYSSDAGSVLMDRALYSKSWGDDLVDAFDLWLDRGANRQSVIQDIKAQYGERYQLFVNTHGELKQAVVDIMEQSFRVNYAVEVIAIVVAVFSVINTLLASVMDRSREIGVLRAVGATQEQMRRILVVEASSMGFLGGLLGLISGTIMSYHHVVYNTKVLTGWTFQYSYPLGVAVSCVVLSVVLCLVAGYVPARRAAALNIVEAIEYE